MAVREQIGAFAAPDVIHWAPGAAAHGTQSPSHVPVSRHVCQPLAEVLLRHPAP